MSQRALGSFNTDEEKERQRLLLAEQFCQQQEDSTHDAYVTGLAVRNGDNTSAGNKQVLVKPAQGDDPGDRPGLTRSISTGAERSRSTPGGDLDEETTYADRLRSSLVHGDAIKDMPSPTPLVDGLLDRDTLALVYGPSGSTKTFVSLDLSLSVGTGTWWHGREVDAGPVLYVVAEGLGGVGARVDAWQHHRNVQTCGETFWLPMAVSLLGAVSVDALVEIAGELQPRFIVVDTFARCMVGGDENTAKDVGLAVENAERLRRACGGCILLVHHSGKDEAAGARGSSALRAAVSTEIECRHVDGVTTLRQTKQREHEVAEPVRLSLVPVRESCAFEQYRGDDASLSKGALELLAELAAIADAEGVSASVWRLSSGVADRSFYRRSKALVDLGYCHKVGAKAQARYTVSDLGRQALGQ